MSGPKDVDYTEREVLPPPPPPVYYTHRFKAGDRAHAAETLAILGSVSGVSIRIQNGEIVATYADYTHWSYSELSKVIAAAKEKAERNLAYVRQVVENSLRACSDGIRKINETFDASVKNIDEAIARLESLKHKVSAPISTPSRTFTFEEGGKDIDKELAKLRSERQSLLSEKQAALAGFESYKRRLERVETSAELKAAEDSRPSVGLAVVDPSIEVDKIASDIEAKYEVLKAFTDAVNKLYDLFDKENLGEYRVRLDDKVNALDPFDKKSLEALDKLVNDIIQEREFKVKDLEARKEAEKNKDVVAHQLDELREISKTLRPIIFKIDEQEHEVVDVTEVNKEALEKIKEVITSTNDKEYISRDNKDKLLKIKRQISRLEGLNLNNPRITAELKAIALEAAKLIEEINLQNEKYLEYLEVMEDYLKSLSHLKCLDDSIQDLADLSKYTFTMENADKLIENMKKAKEDIEKIIHQIMSRSIVSSIGAAVGGDAVFSKQQDGDKFSFNFVRKESKGVMFCVTPTEKGATITPRGVILSNGQKVISEEELRKVHESCEWSEELNEKLVKIGMPPFTTKEHGKEATEALYEEENYFHIEDDESSIRYLKLCGFSDEEIKEVFHYDVRTMARVEEGVNSAKEAEEALEKDLDDK